MIKSLPKVWNIKVKDIVSHINKSQQENPVDARWSVLTSLTGMLILLIMIFNGNQQLTKLISPLAFEHKLHPLEKGKNTKEVFGFAPYWNLDNGKLNSVDFSVLTTFAYFGVPVNADGTLAKDDVGYQGFLSNKSTDLFTKAHQNNTRVVLTITQMDDATIETFLDNPAAQKEAIAETVDAVAQRGIDGINIDFEVAGNTPSGYQPEFTSFVHNLTQAMHSRVPGSQVTVSVYAAAAKNKRIYDLSELSKDTDGIFMMAYDFATAGSDYAMPTAPLYGAKKGVYWYDVSSAVQDFLAVMPANKLILGVPEYGYNYAVDNPKVKSETLPYWEASSYTQTYSQVKAEITPAKAQNYQEGWDNVGQVGWKSYYDPSIGDYRIIFIEDARSIGKKVDFAKSENLEGVGVWALGNDAGTSDIWGALSRVFDGRPKIADSSVAERQINETTY